VVEVPTIREYEAYADKTTIAKADEDLALKKALLDDAQAELDRLINLQNSPRGSGGADSSERPGISHPPVEVDSTL
jgi:hypothetical protein